MELLVILLAMCAVMAFVAAGLEWAATVIDRKRRRDAKDC